MPMPPASPTLPAHLAVAQSQAVMQRPESGPSDATTAVAEEVAACQEQITELQETQRRLEEGLESLRTQMQEAIEAGSEAIKKQLEELQASVKLE